MLTEDGKPRRELYIPDMLHMNSRGYAIWTGKVRDILSEIFPVEMGKEFSCESLFGCPREFFQSEFESKSDFKIDEVNS